MAFLRNTWYAALWSQDLAPGQMLARTFLDEPVVLFRDEAGKASALADACPHRFAPLSMGRVVGASVRCPYHALEFDGSGSCTHNPHGSGQVPSQLKVRSYPVAEKHTLLWIWMGEGEGDPAAIPDFSVLDPVPGKVVSKRDWILMEADYRLVTDNLMDLSHTAVVHEGILGNEHTIKAKLTVEQNGTQVKVGRSIPGEKAVGLYDLIYQRDERPVDLWMDMRWDAPACMINDTGVTEPGAPREQGTGFFGVHLLTPQSETTTYYLFAAVRRNPISWGQPLDGEIQAQLSELRRIAFQEQDQDIIKAQQAVMQAARRRDQARKPVLLEIDVGPVRCERILEQLIAQERQTA